MKKRINKCARIIISALLISYCCLVILFHLPFVQRKLGEGVAQFLSDQLSAQVEVGSINLGLLNRLIIDDVQILDREHKRLLSANRLSVSLSLLQLMQGDIHINMCQAFGLEVNLYRRNPKAELNCQFIIDQLASDSKEEKPGPDLQLKALLVRHANMRYDVLSEKRTPGMFNANHLDIRELSLTSSIKALRKDSINVSIRRLSLTEKNSGFVLQKLALAYEGSSQQGALSECLLQLPHTQLALRDCKVSRIGKPLSQLNFSGTIQPSMLDLTDFHSLLPQLKPYDVAVDIGPTSLTLQNGRIHAPTLSVRSRADGFNFKADAAVDIQHPLDAISLQDLEISCKQIFATHLLASAEASASVSDFLSRIGDIRISGDLARKKQEVDGRLNIETDAGSLQLESAPAADGTLQLHAESTDLSLARLLAREDAGEADFRIDATDVAFDGKNTIGQLTAEIRSLAINGYTYHDLTVEAQRQEATASVRLDIDDPNLQATASALLSDADALRHLQLEAHVARFRPNDLGLTSRFENENIAFSLSSDLSGSSLNDVAGTLALDSIRMTTATQSIQAQSLQLHLSPSAAGMRTATLSGNFMEGYLQSNSSLTELPAAVGRILGKHFPALIDRRADTPNAACDVQLRITDSRLLAHLLDKDIQINQPLTISGNIDTRQTVASLTAHSADLLYNGTQYRELAAQLTASPTNCIANAAFVRQLEDNVTLVRLSAEGTGNRAETSLQWQQEGSMPMSGHLKADIGLDKINELLTAAIHVRPSDFVINDTVWHLSQSNLRVAGDKVDIYRLQLFDNTRSLTVHGTASAAPSDTLRADLQGIPVDYVLGLVNFHAVDFNGKAFGNINISQVMASKPHLSANLQVNDFTLMGGPLGTADIHALWNQDTHGIEIDAHIYDTDNAGAGRTTTCRGYVAPAENNLQLDVHADNTNVAFLNSLLGGIFSDVEGSAFGDIHVLGPLSDISIVGDFRTNASLTLRPTSVRYHIHPDDTIRFRPYSWRFPNIRIADDEGNMGRLNGTVTHRNVKNFAYRMQLSMNQLKAYEEQKFNSDKFMGCVYANGNIDIQGADAHPLVINADVVPTRGSWFAYDAASPDAITSNGFITFTNSASAAEASVRPQETDTQAIPRDALATAFSRSLETLHKTDEDNSQGYAGDIYMNIGVALNPDCEIRLRMDQTEDGYITTYGTGTLQAKYHNKSPFGLYGTYDIDGGKYHLYLQDIIYRDLSIQDGSSVVFNGNPFDANIHLNCVHTLNAVPLTDLTTSASGVTTNKVKVNCLLDITGKLGNMDFKFDLELPNVSDETRRYVKSLISTEEEMNMQMIYLLGIGRFYTAEYARATGESGNSQAVNSLLSSTISGQINQMLSQVIGTDSKWNFGTGLSTGEQGWQDLDVEGMLAGRLLDDRLLINGNFGYRDNAMTQNSSFIGDFDVKWRLTEQGNTFLKAYNKANDRYFTKSTLNTQGIGISFQRDFEHWKDLFRRKIKTFKADSTRQVTLP